MVGQSIGAVYENSALRSGIFTINDGNLIVPALDVDGTCSMSGTAPFLIPIRTSCLIVVESLATACTASGALSGSPFVDSLYVAQKRISVVGDMSEFTAVQLTSLQRLSSNGTRV